MLIHLGYSPRAIQPAAPVAPTRSHTTANRVAGVAIAFRRLACAVWSVTAQVFSLHHIPMSLTTPENIPEFYVQAVLSLYLELTDTQPSCPSDEAWARCFFQQGIPFAVVEAALLLGSLRRAARSPQAPPLQPIRSLAYFQPIIQELLPAPVSEAFRASLRRKLQRLRSSSPHAQP